MAKQTKSEISNNEMLKVILSQLDNRENDFYQELQTIKEEVRKTLIQATKTNGRVNELEKDNITVKAYCFEFHDKIKEIQSYQSNCPINTIKDETEAFRFFVKYPKIRNFLLLLLAIVLGLASLSQIQNLLK